MRANTKESGIHTHTYTHTVTHLAATASKCMYVNWKFRQGHGQGWEPTPLPVGADFLVATLKYVPLTYASIEYALKSNVPFCASLVPHSKWVAFFPLCTFECSPCNLNGEFPSKTIRCNESSRHSCKGTALQVLAVCWRYDFVYGIVSVWWVSKVSLNVSAHFYYECRCQGSLACGVIFRINLFPGATKKN